MELRHLRYFQAVAEELSFSRAAKRLNIAQPALSRAVQQLEHSLGAAVLERSRHMVRITPAGEVLLREGSVLLQQVEEVRRRVLRTAAGEEGELRLGYIGPPTEEFLGRVLAEFRRRYPRVSVILQERTPERVWEMVANGRLSVGLTRPVLADHALGLRTLLLRREPLWAVTPKGHPLARAKSIRWNQLQNEPLVLLARREGVGLYESILQACERERFTPRVAHTPSLMSTVLTYVEAGAGIGIMSDSVTALGANRPLEFRLLTPKRTVDLVMVWSERDESRPTAAFRELIRESLARKILWR
jgi:DNA-binding transcriptional LysR family regulator